MKASREWLALLLLCWLLILAGLQGWITGRTLLPVDDLGGVLYPRNPYVSTAETARDLWHLRTLERPAFHELRSYFLRTSAAQPGLTYHQDVFSLTLEGRLLPKHPLLPSFLGAVFYGLAGSAGFWLMEQLLIVALALSGYSVARSLGAGVSPALAAMALLLFGTKVFWFYSWNFSYDLLGASLILGGLALLPGRPMLAGVLWGLALHIRITHAVFFPFLLVACHPWSRPFPRQWLACTFSCLVVALPHFLYGALYFGDALRGSYSRVPIYSQGTEWLDTSSMHFSWSYLREAVARLAGAGHESVLIAYPTLLALPVALWRIFTPRHSHSTRRKSLGIAFAALASLLLHLSYSYWIGSGGDRFVLAAVCLVLPLTALAWPPTKAASSSTPQPLPPEQALPS